jgi:hypothetical protein
MDWIVTYRPVISRSSTFAATLAVFVVLGIGGIAQTKKPGPAKPAQPKVAERPPAIERITEHSYRVGAALIDTAERTVTCPGEINMDEGAIEYLAVAPGGKTHESLLRIDVRPLHLQLALLMIDLEPKNVLTQQGEKTTPQGDPVEIRVRWKDNAGHDQDVRAEDLVADGAPNKQMPRHDWVFTGSRILKAGFQADLEKSLIAVWHDPAAILDNPLPGGGNNAYLVNTKRTPRRGTRVRVVLRAVAPALNPRSVKSEPGGRP